jgi:Trp operon repressor
MSGSATPGPHDFGPERLALMRRLVERRTTQRVVAQRLGLTIRQVQRLYATYKAKG